MILLLVVYFTYVETTGMTLEEIAVLFDDADEIFNANLAVGKELDAQRKESICHVENVTAKAGEEKAQV